MKRKVFVDGAFAAVDRGLDSVESISDLFELRRGRAFSGEPGSLDLDARAQFHDVEHLAQRRSLVEVDAKRPTYMICNECSNPLPGYHQTIGAQGRNRFADHGAADTGRGY